MSPGHPANGPSGTYVFRPPAARLGIAAWPVGVLIAPAVAAFYADPPLSLILAGVVVTGVAVVAWDHAHIRIEVRAGGVVIKNPWTRPHRLAWRDVAAVTVRRPYRPWAGAGSLGPALVFVRRRGRDVVADISINLRDELRRELLEHIGAAASAAGVSVDASLDTYSRR